MKVKSTAVKLVLQYMDTDEYKNHVRESFARRNPAIKLGDAELEEILKLFKDKTSGEMKVEGPGSAKFSFKYLALMYAKLRVDEGWITHCHPDGSGWIVNWWSQ